MKIKLQRVHYIPKELMAGILYVSEEYGAVAHLCPCGCGSKIRTPLGPTEWTLTETKNGPSLSPSIGSWQLPCKSHYWIRNGEIIWSNQWTPEQISFGREVEEKKRKAYYESLNHRQGFFYKIHHKILKLFGLKRDH